VSKIKEKNKIHLRYSQRNTRNNREKYEEARKETSKVCKKKRKQWMNKRIKYIEEHHTKKDNRKFLKMSKKFKRDLYQDKLTVKMKWEVLF
jgi:hypothetical protein